LLSYRALSLPVHLQNTVDAYTAWIRALRLGKRHTPPVTDGRDPLAPLGHELELLSRAITRREDELRKLFDLVQTVESGVLLDEVLANVFEGFTGLIPFERIGCAFLSDDGRSLVAYWAKSEMGPVHLGSGFSQPMAGSSLVRILESGQPRIINDLAAYFAAKPESRSTKLILDEGGRSSLTCPLFVEGRPLGFLFFTSARAGAYEAAHQTVFRQIAAQVAMIIDRSRMYERLIAHNRRLLDQTRHLELVATTDALTKVLNRRAIEDAVAQAWSDYVRFHHPFGVLLVDIDHFKAVNDTFGHTTGDRVLCEFAACVGAEIRKTDAIGRYGGEEFLLVVDGMDSAGILHTAERLRQVVAGYAFALDGHGPLTASFGAVAADASAVSAFDLIQRADRALYTAKAQGRNRSVLSGR
jgi:diguanylate cyclase (GGDEF)-like protein